MARWTSKYGKFEFFDGAGHTKEVGPGPGDTSIDGFEADNYEVFEARDRGVHDGLVPGPDKVQAISIGTELRNEPLTGGPLGPPTVLDWINRTGIVETYTSMDPCAWAFGVRWILSDGATTTTVTLPKVRPTTTIANAPEGATSSISCTNYLRPVIT